jgi:hypothetical protein
MESVNSFIRSVTARNGYALRLWISTAGVPIQALLSFKEIIMKKIGFIDYYISEWHANNYPAWIEAASGRLGLDYKVAYAYAEMDISPLDGVSTDEWCAKFGVTRCHTVEELCRMSDAVVILAPSNPEKHLDYVREAFKSGKIYYVDKTFTDSLESAREIYSIARENNVSFFSTSALRYADELSGLRGTRVFTRGSGSNAPEYIIHQLEMIVKCIGTGAVSLVSERIDDRIVTSVRYPDGREAGTDFNLTQPFEVSVDGENIAIKSSFFDTLMENIVRFFDNGAVPFSPDETIEAIRLRDGFMKSLDAFGTEIILEI